MLCYGVTGMCVECWCVHAQSLFCDDSRERACAEIGSGRQAAEDRQAGED